MIYARRSGRALLVDGDVRRPATDLGGIENARESTETGWADVTASGVD